MLRVYTDFQLISKNNAHLPRGFFVFENFKEFTVTELSALLKHTVEETFKEIRLRGEVSGAKQHSSGHLYFRLKDKDAVIDAVAWRGSISKWGVVLQDGMEIICAGRLTTYPGGSRYQIIVDTVELAGEGALLKIIEDRKRKLAAEGLFSEARKKALPFLPQTIGVITSATGAVIRDILHRIQDRFPCHVVVWPVAVQGPAAATQIIAAIRGFQQSVTVKPDVLMIARGGGSLEDLWPFNDEDLVRAIAACKIPTICAVGHETDVTLADFAADRRAPTPSAGAEMAVPVRLGLLTHVERMNAHLRAASLSFLARGAGNMEKIAPRLGLIVRLFDDKRMRLEDWQERLAHPQQMIQNLGQRLTLTLEKIHVQVKDVYIKAGEGRVHLHGQLLESLSYHRVLERGFSLITTKQGKAISSSHTAREQALLTLRFHDGLVDAKVAGPPKEKKQKPPSSSTLLSKQGFLFAAD